MAGLGVDRDDTFWRVQRLPQERAAHVGHPHFTGLARRLLPEENAEVRRFDHVAGDAVGAVLGFETRDEFAVLLAVDALEVVPRRVVSDHVLDLKNAQLVLGDADRHHRRLLRGDSGGLQSLVEGNVGRPDDGAEDDVGLGGPDLVDDVLHLRAAEEDVLLAHLLDAHRLELIRDDCVDAVRPHVIRAHQEEAPAEVVDAPLHRRRDLLVRRGARVDDVGRDLEALVRHRVDQQVIVLLHHRADGFTAGGSPAADDHVDALVADETLGLGGIGGPVGTAVGDHRLDATSENAAARVHLIDGQQLGVDHRLLADRHRAGLRMQDAELDRGGGALRQPARVDSRGACNQKREDNNYAFRGHRKSAPLYHRRTHAGGFAGIPARQ
jgi:hypothetical protein